jgi:ABC-2 type transport system ATP-binding protein
MGVTTNRNDGNRNDGPAIEAQDLVKTYPGGVEAVRGISFEVAAGEAFGLLGPNGAGKSTTIGMLNSTVRPTSGRAFLGGIDVDRDPIGTRAISSVVFQDTVVDRPLTGRRNLDVHLRLWGVPMASGTARLAELTKTVGIADILDRPVATYSGGQRRRLEIVRALLSAPRVLFLDEPTVGLDTRIRHELFDVIATLRERTGVTIIMTTHYLDEAERLCDRLAVIDRGSIVACDTPANLLATIGDDVLELRVDDAGRAAAAVLDEGVPADDVLIVGDTVTIGLRAISSNSALGALATAGVPVRSATTRRPTLDDVYLRLTGDPLLATSGAGN